MTFDRDGVFRTPVTDPPERVVGRRLQAIRDFLIHSFFGGCAPSAYPGGMTPWRKTARRGLTHHSPPTAAPRQR